MKRYLLIAWILFSCNALFAEETSPAIVNSPRTAMNVFTFMFLGDGLHVSVHYERFITDALSIRAGIGATGFNFSPDPNSPDGTGYQWVPVLPFTVNYYIGDGKDRLELGAGAFIHLSDYGWEPMFPDFNSSKVKGTLTIGYRYQPLGSGFNAGIGITPVFDTQHIAPWLGFYLGYGF